MMQKEQNVTSPIFLIVIFIFSINIGFSQNKIDGTYKSAKNTINFNFKTNGIFNRKDYEPIHGQLNGYGKGHYFIRNDSLILNYDLTELKKNSYHTYKYYANSNDSIQIKLKIEDLKKSVLSNISVYTLSTYNGHKKIISTFSDKEGIAILKLKKRKQKEKIEIIIEGEFLVRHFIHINTDVNYIINVFLSRNEVYNWQHPLAFKYEISKYKILKLSKEEIKLRKDNNFLILKKQSP